jgi:hypothetical protein
MSKPRLVKPPSERALAPWRARAPEALLDMWQTHGWGAVGDGFLHFVDPASLVDTCDEWLGGPNPTRIPLGRTGLGDLIYFRDLRERARALGMTGEEAATACDVNAVNVRYKRVSVLATSIGEFIERLDDPAWLTDALDKTLFDRAVARLGPLGDDEIFGFVPALGLGGSDDPENLEKVGRDVHLAILFQL